MRQKRIKPFIVAFLYLVVISYLFFDSVWGMILALPFSIIVYKRECKELASRDIQKSLDEFKELLLNLHSAISAGYSLQNSFVLASKELRERTDKMDMFLRELEIAENRLSMNISIEACINDVGEKLRLSEIKDFARIISTIEKTGGNTAKIIRKTIHNINNRIDVRREVEVTMAAKKLEQKIMMIMPFAMILYLRVANAGYLDSLYGSLFGTVFMSAALLMVGFAWVLGDRIMDVRLG